MKCLNLLKGLPTVSKLIFIALLQFPWHSRVIHNTEHENIYLSLQLQKM